MSESFPVVKESKDAIPLHMVSSKSYAAWLKKQPAHTRAWLESLGFKPKQGNYSLLPGKDGAIEGVAVGVDEKLGPWSLAGLPNSLPPHIYSVVDAPDGHLATQLALGWALGCYRFTRYKKNDKKLPKLAAPEGADMEYVRSMADSINWARDMINTPAGDMHPEALAEEAVSFAQSYKGKASVIKGEGLLKENYPTIYAVGKASSVPPHLVDIRFGRKDAPQVTLVGKGVCFDSGGLDIKSANNMKLMKKDMAGVAIVLALARTILDTGLPVQLRLLLPIVENAVSGNATRPLDIVKTRKGITVEIGNTDAEGRLILCDALYEADQEQPDLLIDCSTLTGAARVALGTEIPAFFTNDNKLAHQLATQSEKEVDPVWRLPLWKGYRSFLDSKAADMNNDPDNAYGGAITAALYLQEFVSKTPSWLHLDMMAWNLRSLPGRPVGGEAMAIRALYALIKERYGS